MQAPQREWNKDWTSEVWNVNWANEQMPDMGANVTEIWIGELPDSKYEMVTLTTNNAPEIAVWSAEYFQKVATFTAEFYALGFDVAGNTGKAVLCGAYSAAKYSVWDLEKGEKVRLYERGDPPFESVAICDTQILLGTRDSIAQFDLETGRPGKVMKTNCTEGVQLCKDVTNHNLVFAADKKKSTIAAYDFRSGSAMPARSFLGLPNAELATIRMRAYGQPNTMVAATGNQIRVFDVSSGKTLHTISNLAQYRSYRQVDIARGYVVAGVDYEGLHFYNIAGGDTKEPEYKLDWSNLQTYKMAVTPSSVFVNYVTSMRRATLP